VYWQDLPEFSGQKLYMDAITLPSPDYETIVLAANEKIVSFYSRSANSELTQTVVLDKVRLNSDQIILDAQFLSLSEHYVFLTTVTEYMTSGQKELHIFPVLLTRKEICTFCFCLWN